MSKTTKKTFKSIWWLFYHCCKLAYIKSFYQSTRLNFVWQPNLLQLARTGRSGNQYNQCSTCWKQSTLSGPSPLPSTIWRAAQSVPDKERISCRALTGQDGEGETIITLPWSVKDQGQSNNAVQLPFYHGVATRASHICTHPSFSAP